MFKLIEVHNTTKEYFFNELSEAENEFANKVAAFHGEEVDLVACKDFVKTKFFNRPDKNYSIEIRSLDDDKFYVRSMLSYLNTNCGYNTQKVCEVAVQLFPDKVNLGSLLSKLETKELIQIMKAMVDSSIETENAWRQCNLMEETDINDMLDKCGF